MASRPSTSGKTPIILTDLKMTDTYSPTRFSPLALRTVVFLNSMIQETLPANQAPPMVTAAAEEDKEEGAQVIQLLVLMAVPPVAVILIKSTDHSQ